MPLDINGYNDTFKAFVDFAQAKKAANDKTAVARGSLGEDGVLAGREIKAAPSKILAAMCVLHKGAFDVRRDSGVLHQFNDPGADDVGAVNAFAMAIVFSRCGDRTLRGLREGLHSENSAKVQLALEGIGYKSKANDVRNAALTLGGLFWRDAVSALNDTIGDNAHLVEPALVNTHYDMSRKEFNEINRILEAHAPQVSV